MVERSDLRRLDFTTMWGCDTEIVDDMATVFAYIGHNNPYPDALGYGPQFEHIRAAVETGTGS